MPFVFSCLEKNLHLSTFLAQKKFRHRGNKEGALNAFHALESAGLGKLKTDEKEEQLRYSY